MNNHKKSDALKIQLTRTINFISSKDTDELCVMHSKSDNIEIMVDDKEDEVIKKLFKSCLYRYQIVLKTSIKGSDFIFDLVDFFFHYKFQKINLNGSRSYIDSPDRIKAKKATKNPINDDVKCFQYAAVAAYLMQLWQHI